MASEQFSLRLPKDTKSKLEELAKATGRSKSFIALEAIEKYCETEAWQLTAIQKGLKQAEDGEFISNEELKANWEAR
ncbi:MAG: ribbon-helix-helix protein, CopG family [bacterium]